MEPIRAAVVKDGKVTNIILVTNLDKPIPGIDGKLVACPMVDGIGIDSTYDEQTKEFSPVPEAEPK
jgi:hypothetical protein